MKCLIVEDAPTARMQMGIFLSDHFSCEFAENGVEAIEAFNQALEQQEPFDLVCLDIMMPQQDGHETLKQMRKIESEHEIAGLDGVKVIMTTALDDSKNLFGAFREGCEAYLVKPVRRGRLLEEVEKLGLLSLSES